MTTTNDLQFISQLEEVIGDRIANPGQESYTAGLVALGPKRMAQKVGEEAVELALASVDGTRREICEEAADLLYHLLVLLNAKQIRCADVVEVLEARHAE